MPVILYSDEIQLFDGSRKVLSSKPPDPHVSILQFMNNFRCEKNVETPTYWNCKHCDYYYKDDLDCSKCLKREIQNWVMFRDGMNK